MAAVLAVLILIGGCSRLNPFVKESTETEARFEPNKFFVAGRKRQAFVSENRFGRQRTGRYDQQLGTG